MYTNIQKYTQIYTNIHRYTLIYTNIYRYTRALRIIIVRMRISQAWVFLK